MHLGFLVSTSLISVLVALVSFFLNALFITKFLFKFKLNLDFDGDDMLGIPDLRQVVHRLTGSQSLTEQDMQLLIQNILEEADLDDDGALSFAEFEHIIDKSSDFAK